MREVRLRAWCKPHFEEELHRYDDMFAERLAHFLKPLTNKIHEAMPNNPNTPDPRLKRVIFLTMNLWWVLSSLHTRITFIEPIIGSHFDSKVHQPFNGKGCEYDDTTILKGKLVKWILRRGFQFCSTEGDETTLVTVKAHVVL